MRNAKKHHRRWALGFLVASATVFAATMITGMTSFGLLLIAAFLALAAVISLVLSFFELPPDGYDLTQSMGQLGRGFARGLHMKTPPENPRDQASGIGSKAGERNERD